MSPELVDMDTKSLNEKKAALYSWTYLVAIVILIGLLAMMMFFNLSPVGQVLAVVIIAGMTLFTILFRIKFLAPFLNWLFTLSTIFILVCWAAFPAFDNMSPLSVSCYIGALFIISLHGFQFSKLHFGVLAVCLVLSTSVLGFSLVNLVCTPYLLFSLWISFNLNRTSASLETVRRRARIAQLTLQSQRYWGHHILNPLSVIAGHLSLFNHTGVNGGNHRGAILKSFSRIKKSLEVLDLSDSSFEDRSKRNIYSPYSHIDWSPSLLGAIYFFLMSLHYIIKGFHFHLFDLTSLISISILLFFPSCSTIQSKKLRGRVELVMMIAFQLSSTYVFYLGGKEAVNYVGLFGAYLSSMAILARAEKGIAVAAGVSASILSLVTLDPLITPFMICCMLYFNYLNYSATKLNNIFYHESELMLKREYVSDRWLDLKNKIVPRVDAITNQLMSSDIVDYDHISDVVENIQSEIAQIDREDGLA